MEILKYCAIALLTICFFIILVFSARTKKALKLLLFNSFLGLGVLFALYFTKKYTGIILALNEFTVIGSSILGIPAVIGFLILNLLF